MLYIRESVSAMLMTCNAIDQILTDPRIGCLDGFLDVYKR